MASHPESLRRIRIGHRQGVKWLLILLALTVLGLLLVLPLATVFIQAFSKGVAYYFHAIAQEDTLASIRLTLLAAGIAVPVNVVFGVAAAWAVTKFDFRGKSLLLALIDLPFSISPIVSGLIFALLFGLQGVLHPWLEAWDVQVLFAVPGIVLATIFVTFPFVAREVIPVMQAAGTDEELASLVLGASGWRTFWKVTIPNIKWGLLYGVILCNARAMGEFGAVSVVSGHISGETLTIPLQVETLYNDYDATGAFAVATLLAFLSVLTLVAKKIVEGRVK